VEHVIKKYKKSIALFLLCLYVLINIGKAQTQTVTPGVNVGDTFTYEFTVLWSSANPNATPPASLIHINETDYIKVTIAEIGGPVVFMNITRHFKNGTETSTKVFVHLLSGDGDGFGLLVAPNLDEKSLAYPMGIQSGNLLAIDEVVVKTYSFGEREVLHTTLNKTDVSDYAYIYYNIYFDKKTGVMLEWLVEQASIGSSREKTSLIWKIKEFNLKGAASQNQQAQFPPGLIGIITLIIIVALITIYIYKRRK
jgi:hypothetical protein